MLPPELSLRSPLPSPLATNNSPPEGPMRFAKMVFLVNVCCAEASTKAPSTRKNAMTVIPSFVMEVLPSGLLMRASYASPALDTTNLPRERIIASSIGPRHLTKRFRIWRRGWDLTPPAAIEYTQLTHFALRPIRQKRPKRQTEVHGRYTERRDS